MQQVMWKVQKVESVDIQSDSKTTSNKRTDLSCVLHVEEKYEMLKTVTQNDYMIMCFVKMIKLQEHKFKIIQKNF